MPRARLLVQAPRLSVVRHDEDGERVRKHLLAETSRIHESKRVPGCVTGFTRCSAERALLRPVWPHTADAKLPWCHGCLGIGSSDGQQT